MAILYLIVFLLCIAFAIVLFVCTRPKHIHISSEIKTESKAQVIRRKCIDLKWDDGVQITKLPAIGRDWMKIEGHEDVTIVDDDTNETVVIKQYKREPNDVQTADDLVGIKKIGLGINRKDAHLNKIATSYQVCISGNAGASRDGKLVNWILWTQTLAGSHFRKTIMAPVQDRMDRHFASIAPDQARKQQTIINTLPIDLQGVSRYHSHTTVNLNVSTGTHTDHSNLPGTLSSILVLHQGIITGGELVLPNYGIVIEAISGVIITCDFRKHQHCNLPIVQSTPDSTRIAVIQYINKKSIDLAWVGRSRSTTAKPIGYHSRSEATSKGIVGTIVRRPSITVKAE